MRRIVVTGVVALAAALGAWGAVSAASAGTSAPASVTAAGPASAPVSPSFAKPGALPVSHHLTYPAGVRPAVTASFNILQDVSCLNPKDCLAVGVNTAANGGLGSPIAFLWNGSWHATAVHLPSGATGGALLSVSCKPGACVAVGTYVHGSSSSLLSEIWKGAGWINSPQPAAISGAKVGYLAIASCFSSTFCVAGGLYVPSANTNQSIAIAEVWNGTSWRLSKPTPPGPNHFAGFFSVSCPAANLCWLGGEYATADQGFFGTLIEKFDGAHWSAPVTDAAPTPTQGFAALVDSISCTTTTSCAIVGQDTPAVATSTPVWHAFAETLSGTTWTRETVAFPASPGSTLNAVSCPTTTYCLAVGGFGTYANATTGRAAYAVWTGGTSWAIHYLTLPSSDAGQGSLLIGVQCLTATSCNAAGLAGKYNTNTGHGLTGFWNGSAFTVVNTA